jgi:hypothetical protein
LNTSSGMSIVVLTDKYSHKDVPGQGCRPENY